MNKMKVLQKYIGNEKDFSDPEILRHVIYMLHKDLISARRWDLWLLTKDVNTFCAAFSHEPTPDELSEWLSKEHSEYIIKHGAFWDRVRDVEHTLDKVSLGEQDGS